MESVAHRPLCKRAALLDDVKRERRRTAERFVGETLSAARESIRKRAVFVFEAVARGERIVPVDSGWRESALRMLADCRQVLNDPETYAAHLARLPGAAEEMERLTEQLENNLGMARFEHARREERHRRRGMERGGNDIAY